MTYDVGGEPEDNPAPTGWGQGPSWPPPPPNATPPYPGPPPYAGQPYSGQPYPGQPYPGQPYAGPPGWSGPPPRRRGRSVAIGLGVAAAAVVVLGIIGAVVKQHHHSPGSVTHNPGAAVPSGSGAGTPIGFTTFRSTQDRFTVAIPSSWKTVDISSPGAQAAMNEMVQANPNLKSAFAQGALRLAENGMVLMAINPITDAQDFSSNVNVIAKADVTYSESELGQVAASIRQNYPRLGGSVTGTDYVTLAGHRALKATERLSVNRPDGAPVTIDQVQYYFGANGLLFVLTLSGDDPALARIASTFATS